MKIQVTLMDVLKGRRRDSSGCMVARAVKRQIPWLHNLRVAAYGMEGVVDESWLCLPFPQITTDKIRSWDSRGFVLPFTFELDVDLVKITPPKHGMMNAMLAQDGVR